MKKHAILSALAFGALLGPAMAADLAPLPPPAPPCGWCGWYVGVNAGGIWEQDATVQTLGSAVAANNLFAFNAEATVAANLATTSLGSKQSGFIGGGQFGYNTQYYSWVGGFEADLQGLSNSRSSASATSTSGVPGFPTERFTSTTMVSKGLDYLGTLRARVGYLATPAFLIYGTAGLAYGGVHASTNISQVDNGNFFGFSESAPSSATGSGSELRAGWTAGGGVEMQLWSRWTAKAEYLYYDLGTAHYAANNLAATVPSIAILGPTWVTAAQSSAHFNGSIARLGLNYRF